MLFLEIVHSDSRLPVLSNSLSLEEQKEDLTEEEFFFELDDTDQIFSSWSNFLGEASDEAGSETHEEVDESES